MSRQERALQDVGNTLFLDRSLWKEGRSDGQSLSFVSFPLSFFLPSALSLSPDAPPPGPSVVHLFSKGFTVVFVFQREKGCEPKGDAQLMVELHRTERNTNLVGEDR